MTKIQFISQFVTMVLADYTTAQFKRTTDEYVGIRSQNDLIQSAFDLAEKAWDNHVGDKIHELEVEEYERITDYGSIQNIHM
jgi:hypothetical protein